MELDKEDIMKIQTLEMQMKQVEQVIEKVDEQLGDVQNTLAHLEEYKKVKTGDELLVSVVNGVFTKATAQQPEQLYVNVGSNVVTGKTVDDIKQLISQQAQELLTYKEELLRQFQQFVEEAQQLDKKITKEKHKELHKQ